MPTYEYVCDACGHTFDELQSFSEPVLTKCPQCGKKKLRRLFGTGAAVLFKGSGFYETDYRSESYKSGAKAEKNSAPKAEGSADSPKADSKDSPKAESTAKPESSAKSTKSTKSKTETKGE